ncbi:pentapeptide repeat-containing protein [Demequina flava]|uniref:pentapeptide repeat-containing protein n=1 Tax=Demequina flava TaxID=1095025 RepID=UPI0007830DB7|nr:pentapeptide repeat-containing protein [Demequina flava]
MSDPHKTGVRGFVSRNSDALWLEVIGGVILALAVSGVMYWVDQSRTDARNAHDESLSNSLFVRQAAMSDTDVLPLSSLYLEGAQLSGLPLAGADFSDADLTRAELKHADLTEADMREVDATGADMSGALLVRADLSEAILRNVDLSGADLTGAVIAETEWSGAYFVSGEAPDGIDGTELGLVEVDPAVEDIDDD